IHPPPRLDDARAGRRHHRQPGCYALFLMSRRRDAAASRAQVEMQIAPVELQHPGVPRGLNRLLANRQLWKNAIYYIAMITYLCSFLFFGLAVGNMRETGGSVTTVIDLIVAL